MAEALLVADQQIGIDPANPTSGFLAYEAGNSAPSGFVSMERRAWDLSGTRQDYSQAASEQCCAFGGRSFGLAVKVNRPTHSAMDRSSAFQRLAELRRRTRARQRFNDELEWIERNRARFAGLWVALEGGRLIASGTSAREAADGANGRSDNPLITKLDDDLRPFTGW